MSKKQKRRTRIYFKMQLWGRNLRRDRIPIALNFFEKAFSRPRLDFSVDYGRFGSLRSLYMVPEGRAAKHYDGPPMKFFDDELPQYQLPSYRDMDRSIFSFIDMPARDNKELIFHEPLRRPTNIYEWLTERDPQVTPITLIWTDKERTRVSALNLTKNIAVPWYPSWWIKNLVNPKLLPVVYKPWVSYIESLTWPNY
jgi:hypothetical protein